MKTPLRNFFIFLLSATVASAADLTSSGDWIENVTAANLTAGAGSDLQSLFESVSGTTVLNISNAPGVWRIKARRGTGQWDNNLVVWVKRTSDGSGSGSVSGGSAYVALDATDTEIFTGSDDRGSISLQFKLTGLTRGVSPATYFSSLVFTVQ